MTPITTTRFVIVSIRAKMSAVSLSSFRIYRVFPPHLMSGMTGMPSYSPQALYDAFMSRRVYQCNEVVRREGRTEGRSYTSLLSSKREGGEGLAAGCRMHTHRPCLSVALYRLEWAVELRQSVTVTVTVSAADERRTKAASFVVCWQSRPRLLLFSLQTNSPFNE